MALPIPPDRNAEKNFTCGETEEEEEEEEEEEDLERTALIGSQAPILILL